MNTKIFVLAAAVALCHSAFAGSFSYFDRPDEASVFSQSAVSNDVYVRGFGYAWGDLRFLPEPGAAGSNASATRAQRDGARANAKASIDAPATSDDLSMCGCWPNSAATLDGNPLLMR